MTKLRELYKCSVCGNVIEVVFPGKLDGNTILDVTTSCGNVMEVANPGTVIPTCCAKSMDKMEAKTQDTGNEKHVPVVTALPGGGIEVKVGDVEHPMVEKHYIAFIEVLTKERVIRVELNPGEKPYAKFCTNIDDVIEVREYCNIHGLWKK